MVRHRAMLALLALAVAGCGGSSGGDASTSSTNAGPSGPSPTAICARIPLEGVERIVDHATQGQAPKLEPAAHGTAGLIKCAYPGHGVAVDLNLDLAANSQQRFDNRVVEMTQFSNGRPATRPRPVPGVGDPKSGNEGAQWIPALDQLLAFRPGRYLIVDFAIHGGPDSVNRAGAAALARLAFPVLPGEKGAGKQRPSPGG